MRVVKGEVESGERRGGMEEVCNLKCVDGEGFVGSFSKVVGLWEFRPRGLGMGMEEVDRGVRLRFLGFGLRWESGR